jgi:antitoxin component YwqK of YwqJK toxin-antitoxin module
MPDKFCIQCGKPAALANIVDTRGGPVHEDCWAAFVKKEKPTAPIAGIAIEPSDGSEGSPTGQSAAFVDEKPVAKWSVVAGYFGWSMAGGGAAVLAIGLAAFAFSASMHSVNSQNPLVGIPAALLMFMSMGVSYIAFLAGAIMLSIAFLTWVVTNNDAFKNYVAGGVAIVALAIFAIGPQLASWANSFERSSRTNSYEKQVAIEPKDDSKPDGTYTEKDEKHLSGTEEVWVGGKRVAYAEQLYWSTGRLQYDNRWEEGKHGETWFYESGMKQAEHRTQVQNTGWWGYWYENGQQKYALNLVNGKREGAQAYWYENGQEKLTGNFANDLPDGSIDEWDANGNESSLCTWNGVNLNGDCSAKPIPR